jgi:GGDEF domain-containing protein
MLNQEAARATVAWLSSSMAPPPARLAAALAESRYAFAPNADAPDIALIDVRLSDDPAAAAYDLIASARRLAPPAGFLIIAPVDADRDQRIAMRKLGDLVFARSRVDHLVACIRERLRLAALAEETGERIKSSVAAGRAFALPKFSEERADCSVLIAGAPSPLSLTANNAVRRWAKETTAVFTAGQVMRALDHKKFDGAIFLPEDEHDLLIPLARALRRHREHRRMPVILSARSEDLLDRLGARDGFEIVREGHLDEDLAQRIAISARRAHMADAMRSFLQAGERRSKGAPHEPKFFATHAARLFRRSTETGRPVSLVGISLSPRGGAVDRGAANDALGRAAHTIGRIVRAEDMLAKLSSRTLVLMAPGARVDDAERMAERIEGVVGGTLARETLESMQIRVGAIERAEGHTIEESIAALIRNIAAAPPVREAGA